MVFTYSMLKVALEYKLIIDEYIKQYNSLFLIFSSTIDFISQNEWYILRCLKDKLRMINDVTIGLYGCYYLIIS